MFEINIIEWLNYWMSNENTKIIYILTLILIANMIDFTIGWVNAKFNPKVQFSSNVAIYGIARKMIMFILCVFFVPVSLLVPSGVGIVALWLLLIGYLVSEINSILTHLRLADDAKDIDLFADFIKSIFKRGEK